MWCMKELGARLLARRQQKSRMLGTTASESPTTLSRFLCALSSYVPYQTLQACKNSRVQLGDKKFKWKLRAAQVYPLESQTCSLQAMFAAKIRLSA